MRARRAGDVLVVWKLARLGHNLAHSVNTVQTLSARGVRLRVLTGQGAQIDTTTATPPCPRSAPNLGSRPWRSTGTSGRKASCASKAKRFSPLESVRASADGWA